MQNNREGKDNAARLTLRLREAVEVKVVVVFVFGNPLLLGGQPLLVVNIFNAAYSIFVTTHIDFLIAQN